MVEKEAFNDLLYSFVCQKAIAILPLVTYISSFCMSLAAPLFNKYLGRKVCIWKLLQLSKKV